jgi:2,3-dihydroxybenzoate decarboxylase
MSHQGSVPRLPYRFKTECGERFQRRLPDFGEYRLPEIDEARIDIRVHVDIEPELARDNARFVNNYVAKVISEAPDRFRGLAALPLQDPAAAAADLERAVTELGG